MRAIIDRFEDKCAVCELDNGKFAVVSRSKLPKGAQESSALLFVCGKWILDQRRTRQLKSRAKALIDELFE